MLSLGYDLSPTQLKPGQALRLTLYWQALVPMDENYTVFAHLLDEKSLIWGQKDSVPHHGSWPVTVWAQGEIVVDEYDILAQIDTPPGQYTLEIGMYQLETGQRLEVHGGPEGEGDRILLGKVEVLE